MPRDLTHVILADESCALLSGPARQCAQKNASLFHLGAVSHDTFLYGSRGNLATKIHGGFGDDTRAVVLEMLDDIRREKDPAVREQEKAFAYGFLSHIASDSVFHPFVYSVSGSQVRENNPDKRSAILAKVRHRYVETWLDVHFMKEKDKSLDTFKPFQELRHDQAGKKAVSDFFCRNFQKAFDFKEDLSSTYRQSLAVQLFVGRVTQGQTLGKVLRKMDNFLDGQLGIAVSGFYQRDRKIPSKLKDFKEFKHPVTGETVHKSLQDLTHDAVHRGVDFIAAAERYIETGNKQEFLKAVPNVNLDTGIENTKLSDIKQATPLAVEELKGSKLKQFVEKGYKVLTSGAKAVKKGVVRTAYPEVRRFSSQRSEVLDALRLKKGVQR
ncbi:MAG: zinc dependent phospholipase C family protein [Alphaproteobacteria bacterium]|nr:zinc dependent phospholipase C family protein [Alphaproteobacteria bacterium]